MKPLKHLQRKPLCFLLGTHHQTLKSVRCCYTLRYFSRLRSSDDDVLSRRDEIEWQKSERTQRGGGGRREEGESKHWIVRGCECHRIEFCALGPSNGRLV